MSDAQPDTGEPATEATEPTVSDTDMVDWKAEAEKYKGLHRKQEERAKANADAAKELALLKQQTMTEVEKAAAEARAEGRTEALREVGSKLVDAEVRAAAAGRSVDVDALLEGLDRSRFIDENGDADQRAIVAWVDRVAPQPEQDAARPGPFDLGQGVRHNASTSLGGDPLERDLRAKLGIS